MCAIALYFQIECEPVGELQKEWRMGMFVLSSAIYSIYYSRYSTPYLSGEGEEGGLVGGGSCGERTRDMIIRRYRTTGIYTFG